MLAELEHLALTLTACGLQPPARHPWVKPLEKGDFIVVSLDSESEITGLEFRPSSDGAGIAKIQKDNHNSFPATKIRTPLWSIATDDRRRAALTEEKLPKERASLLRAMCEGAPSMESLEQCERFAARIGDFARELTPRFASETTNAPMFTALLQAIAKPFWSGDRFLNQITEAAISLYASGAATASSMIESLLIGTMRQKSGRIEAGKATLVFDFARSDGELACRVVHPAMAEVYHRALLGTEPSEGEKGACSLTGHHDELELHKLPNPKLPELNATFLMAMNKDAPCHLRYHRIGASIFPIGKRTAKEINDAILWITAPERQGKTWRLVPRPDIPPGGLPRNDLLLAYAEGRPDLPAALADFFAGASDAGPEGLREWRKAAANAPDFHVLVPKEKGQPAVSCKPWCPSPAQIVRASRTSWIRNGTEDQAVAGCPLSTVHDLFLAEDHALSITAASMLVRLIRQVEPLLVRCGEQLARHGPAVSNMPVPSRRAAVLAATILAMCLFKLNRRKEDYMEAPGFLLGRFLALVDTLHEQYCRVIRKGDLPPQLLGYQHFAMAADNAQSALAVLHSRLGVYYQWARTAEAELANTEIIKSVRLARWAKSRMGEVAEQLTGRIPNRPLNDPERAEMLLGYLARIGKASDAEDDEQPDTINEEAKNA